MSRRYLSQPSFVDAMVSGREPGEITVCDAREGVCAISSRNSTHHFGVAEAVELARVHVFPNV